MYIKNWNSIKIYTSVKGVRFKPRTASSRFSVHSLENEQSLYDSKLANGLNALEELGLIWDLRVPSWHLKDAAKILQDFPNLKVVVNHCGLPWDRSIDGINDWKKGLELLATRGKTWIKLSELGCPGQSYDIDSNQQLLNHTLNIFGGKRALYASNAPVSGVQVSYGCWLEMIHAAINTIAPENKQDVFWKNAIECFDLKGISK
ncbi:hypothetical protein V757_04365 [Pelistega indica]|uniref:Amidohydrolase-related domain-containing protein n=1 Tax=Pelistega indica TaxID=1414851 RepID=V8G9W1_9BURK|nr:amidohydrolase family protein [Pelistega indica]ETD72462.1 hypothetical protein V757_04365 [Pelistega indica]